jgi:hypothetical protein
MHPFRNLMSPAGTLASAIALILPGASRWAVFVGASLVPLIIAFAIGGVRGAHAAPRVVPAIDHPATSEHHVGKVIFAFATSRATASTTPTPRSMDARWPH